MKLKSVFSFFVFLLFSAFHSSPVQASASPVFDLCNSDQFFVSDGSAKKTLCYQLEMFSQSIRSTLLRDRFDGHLKTLKHLDVTVSLIKNAQSPGRTVFPSEGVSLQTFRATIEIDHRAVKDPQTFGLIFLHEADHVVSVFRVLRQNQRTTSFELERRAYDFQSRLEEELNIRPRMALSVWRARWNRLPNNEKEKRRSEAIYKLLSRHSAYKNSRPDKYEVFEFNTGKYEKTREVITNPRWDGSFENPNANAHLPAGVESEPSFALQTPTSDNPEDIWRALIANEANFETEFNTFIYKQRINLHCSNQIGEVIGEYQRFSVINRLTDGTLWEQIDFFPESSFCTAVEPADLEDMTNSFFVLKRLESRNYSFLGFAMRDGLRVARFELHAPPFSSTGEKLGNSRDRYFWGIVEVDALEGQIVFLDGKTGPEDESHKFPQLQVVRQKNRHGIRLPVQVSGSDTLYYPLGFTLRIKTLITYSDYRQFTSDVKILEDISER